MCARSTGLLTGHFGVTSVAAAYGFSMGAGQAYHWAALFPGFVERAIVVCGSARTSVHNKVFLSGLLRTLEAAPQYQGNGRFSAEPVAAVRAFAHIYAGWGLSQDFYRERLFETALGVPDLATFLKTDWEDSFAEHQAANLYAQALTWQEADISANRLYSGDLARRPGRDHGPGTAHAQRDRLVLPGGGQRGGTSLPAQRRAGHDSQHLGSPGGQPGGHPGRSGFPDQPRPFLAGPMTAGPGRRSARWPRPARPGRGCGHDRAG